MSETTSFAAQPLLWAFTLAPLVLGLFAWLIWRQRKALEELRRVAAEVAVTAEFDRFFTLSGDLLAIVGLDGHFKRLNPAWQETLGHSVQVVLKTPFIDFVHPDDRTVTMEELGRLAEGSGTARFENRYLTADGDWRWASWTATPFPDGDLVYYVSRET